MHQLIVVIDELAKHIATECYGQYRRSRRWHHLSYKDYQLLARGTACLAIAQHFGPDELPAQLPHQVKTLGCRFLDEELTGPGSEYYDWRRRNVGVARYKTGHARRCSQAELTDRWSGYRLSLEGVVVDEPWEEEMIVLLTEHLRPDQWELLRAFHLEGRSMAELTQQLIDTTPKYQTSGGYARALSAIGVRLLRARKAARAVLETKFAERAKEVAA